MITYPKVTLIIPNLNGKKLLKECLTSLTKLDYTDYEIIVSDGGSTDGTCDMIKKDFKKVRLIREEGAGIGRSNNLGMKAAIGEIIAFDLNNDEFLHEFLKYGSINNLFRLMNQNKVETIREILREFIWDRDV